MDFRYYVYKINKQFNTLVFLKIFFSLMLLTFLIFTIISTRNVYSGLAYNTQQMIGISGKFVFFDFNNYFTANLIILLTMIFSGLSLIAIITISARANQNIKIASNFRAYAAGKLIASIILDFAFIGFLIILAFKKDIFIKVYNAGVDAWFDADYEEEY